MNLVLSSKRTGSGQKLAKKTARKNTYVAFGAQGLMISSMSKPIMILNYHFYGTCDNFKGTCC